MSLCRLRHRLGSVEKSFELFQLCLESIVVPKFRFDLSNTGCCEPDHLTRGDFRVLYFLREREIRPRRFWILGCGGAPKLLDEVGRIDHRIGIRNLPIVLNPHEPLVREGDAMGHYLAFLSLAFAFSDSSVAIASCAGSCSTSAITALSLALMGSSGSTADHVPSPHAWHDEASSVAGHVHNRHVFIGLLSVYNSVQISVPSEHVERLPSETLHLGSELKSELACYASRFRLSRLAWNLGATLSSSLRCLVGLILLFLLLLLSIGL